MSIRNLAILTDGGANEKAKVDLILALEIAMPEMQGPVGLLSILPKSNFKVSRFQGFGQRSGMSASHS